MRLPFFASVFAIAFLFVGSTTSHAGLMYLSLSAEGNPSNQVEVGESITINVTLNDIDPGWRVVWGVGMDLPENFSAATDFDFTPPMGRPLAQLSGINPLGNFGPEDFSTLMVSVPSNNSSTFSFSTTATSVGQSVFVAQGLAIGVGPGFGGISFVPLSAELTLDVQAPSSAPPSAAQTPEPSSLAIIGSLAGLTVLRRRRRG
ncbi:PEP-CTERM sorting domain-containing protein [Roseiconus lacunae]|uniref:PEP-CTERM sorting domain-containing protein n=2 Tax=Roseiconus lacunae TaxID=2605694 RepID=UPI0011F279A0|nr:PEP-CTERM sorting domain-containing protein [Roseiconus lacunae]